MVGAGEQFRGTGSNGNLCFLVSCCRPAVGGQAIWYRPVGREASASPKGSRSTQRSIREAGLGVSHASGGHCQGREVPTRSSKVLTAAAGFSGATGRLTFGGAPSAYRGTNRGAASHTAAAS